MHVDPGLHRWRCNRNLHWNPVQLQQLEFVDLLDPSRMHLQLDRILQRNAVRLLFDVSVHSGHLRAAGGVRLDGEYGAMYGYWLLLVPHDANGMRPGYRLYLESRRLRRNARLFHVRGHHGFVQLHRPRVHLGLYARDLLRNSSPFVRRHDDKHLLLQLVHGVYLDCRIVQRNRHTLQLRCLSDEFLGLSHVVRLQLVFRGWHLHWDCRRNLRQQYRSSRLPVDQRLLLVHVGCLHGHADPLLHGHGLGQLYCPHQHRLLLLVVRGGSLHGYTDAVQPDAALVLLDSAGLQHDNAVDWSGSARARRVTKT